MRYVVRAVSALILAVSLVGARPPASIEPELVSLLESLSKGEKVPVIVRLSDKVDPGRFAGLDESRRRVELIRALRDKAETTQRPVKTFLKSRGVADPVALWLINGIAFEADADLVGELAAMPGIESVRPYLMKSVFNESMNRKKAARGWPIRGCGWN